MASNDTLVTFTAHANEPPATNYATVDLRNSHMVLDFDDTTAESAVFAGVLPRSYSGGGITATVIWLATSATTGSVKWNAQIERHQDETDDLDADSFAAAQTATGITAAASGAPQYTSIAFTNGAQMDSLAAGESFRLKITRDAADGGDTVTGDAELLRVELRET
jgi:hypothetical protein